MAGTLTPAQKAAVTASTAAIGTAVGLMAKGPITPAHVRGGGLPLAAGNFAAATTNALKHHASLTTALGAGATAAVGGPTVIAAAVAAAPVVLTVGAAVAVVGAGYGLYAWLTDKK